MVSNSQECAVNGEIKIRLHKDNLCYTQGEVIYGRLWVTVGCAKEFEGTELVVGLSGIEYSSFRVNNTEEDS